MGHVLVHQQCDLKNVDEPKGMRGMAAPAEVQIRPGCGGAGVVRQPARLPETHMSREGQQELFGRMDQGEFLSALHIPGNLLRNIKTQKYY